MLEELALLDAERAGSYHSSEIFVKLFNCWSCRTIVSRANALASDATNEGRFTTDRKII
jgi:hypothetical protein